MKIKLLLISIILGVSFFSCGASNASEADIALPTIMCGMCESNIKDAFSETAGIIKVDVDLEKKSGKIYFDSDKVSISQIEKQISGAGYQANNVAADKSAYDKLPRCCKVDG
jgi:copper chaperone CopZ